MLLDFYRMLVWDNATMFTDGPIGQRHANPRHLAALATFVDSYLNATARSRDGDAHMVLYLLNGPGGRNGRWENNMTRVAYGMPPGQLNEALCTNTSIRNELAAFVRAVVATLSPRVVKGLQLRMTGECTTIATTTAIVLLLVVMVVVVVVVLQILVLQLLLLCCYFY